MRTPLCPFFSQRFDLTMPPYHLKPLLTYSPPYPASLHPLLSPALLLPPVAPSSRHLNTLTDFSRVTSRVRSNWAKIKGRPMEREKDGEMKTAVEELSSRLKGQGLGRRGCWLTAPTAAGKAQGLALTKGAAMPLARSSTKTTLSTCRAWLRSPSALEGRPFLLRPLVPGPPLSYLVLISPPVMLLARRGRRHSLGHIISGRRD